MCLGFGGNFVCVVFFKGVDLSSRNSFMLLMRVTLEWQRSLKCLWNLIAACNGETEKRDKEQTIQRRSEQLHYIRIRPNYYIRIQTPLKSCLAEMGHISLKIPSKRKHKRHPHAGRPKLYYVYFMVLYSTCNLLQWYRCCSKRFPCAR